MAQPLGSGHLGRLVLGDQLTLHVAGAGGDQTRGHHGDGPETGDPPPQLTRLEVLLGLGGLDHPPHGHAHDDGCGHQQSRGDDVQHGGPHQLVGQELEEAAHAIELGAARLGVDDGAHRVLHPGVGGKDEEGGEVRAGGHGPHAQVVQPGGQAVPSEDPQAQEDGLHEEGQQGLEGEGGAKDVADEPGVLRPVHAELELLNDAGGHTEREVDE